MGSAMAVTTIICGGEEVRIWRRDGRLVVTGLRLAPEPIDSEWRTRARLSAYAAEQFFGQERDEPPD